MNTPTPTELATIAAILALTEQVHRQSLPFVPKSPRPEQHLKDALKLVQKAEEFIKQNV